MADNYLEKQYADYEIRKAEWLKAKKCRKIKKKNSPLVPKSSSAK